MTKRQTIITTITVTMTAMITMTVTIITTITVTITAMITMTVTIVKKQQCREAQKDRQLENKRQTQLSIQSWSGITMTTVVTTIITMITMTVTIITIITMITIWSRRR